MILVHLLPGSASWGCPEFSFLTHSQKTHPYCCQCSVVTCLQPPAVLLCLPHIWHSCLVSFWGWFEAEKPKPPLLSQTGGLPSPQGVCTALGGHSFTFNSSESISSAPLETVHDPCFSLARVLCWGEASAWWFSAAAKEFFLLPLPSQSPQTLPLPPEPCFGTGHWNFHWGMFSCLSTTGISFFLITGVRCCSDWQITCDQHREKLQFLYLWFSSLFCAVFLSLCWFERCTHTEMSHLSEFVVLGIWSAVLKKLHSLPGYFFPSPSRAEAEKTTQQCCCAGRGSGMLLRMGWVMLSERATPLVDHVGWLQPTLWNAEPQRGCPGDRVTACHN